MDRFKNKAKTWDDNPARVEMAQKFFSEIIKSVDIKKAASILDFGCGTGLLGLQFQDKVNHISMIDTSKEMLDVLTEKIKQNNFKNITIINSAIENAHINRHSFDLIASLMALHHVVNIKNIVNVFNIILKPGGYVIIGDLITEDGSFHNYEHVEHHGFDLDFIKNLFETNGFEIKRLEIFNVLNKPDENGRINQFEQLILIARLR